MVFRMNKSSVFTIAGLCLFLGCGVRDPLARQPISGTVTLDGAPVATGMVNFDPQGGGASTSSGANINAGKFEIAKEVGLPPGNYIVRVSIPKQGTGGVFKEGSMPGDVLAPPEEMAPDEWNVNSKQTIEVKAGGPNEFPLNVTSKKK